MFRILRNTFLTSRTGLERRNTQQEDEEGFEESSVSQETPEIALIRRANTELVQAAIAQLAPAFQEVILLADLEEMKYQEIAEALDIPIGTVMSRLARARKQVREHIVLTLGGKKNCGCKVTNCEWREKIGLYVDGELEPRAEQAFAGHLQSCAECSSAVLEQQALKKAVRVAAKRFSAPPELYASVHRQMQPKKKRAGPWLKWSALAASAVLLAWLSFAWLSRPSASNATVAQLIDQHVIMLASANPVDVISEDSTR